MQLNSNVFHALLDLSLTSRNSAVTAPQLLLTLLLMAMLANACPAANLIIGMQPVHLASPAAMEKPMIKKHRNAVASQEPILTVLDSALLVRILNSGTPQPKLANHVELTSIGIQLVKNASAALPDSLLTKSSPNVSVTMACSSMKKPQNV